MRLTWNQIVGRRLTRHGLMAPVPTEGMAKQVAAICGAHAQVMSAAEVSIGLRVAGITRQDIRVALWEERTLVKAFGPRGTVHVLAADELPVWNAVLETAIVPPTFPPDVRMDPEQTGAVVAAIDAALTDADLTADELGAEVVKRTGAWAGDLVMPAFQGYWPRWMQALRAAANRGVLCFGPNRGAKTTYASPRRWLGDYRPVLADDAVATVLRRYLHAYGPARPEHFARWLGATHAWAQAVFRRAGQELERVELDGEELWQLADGETLTRNEHTVRLLPYFDAYAVGCFPRERLFPGPAGERALTRSQAGNVPVLLVDGIVAGIWHQRRSGRKLSMTVEPFHRLTAAERRGLDEQAERIGQIQEATASLTIGAVTAGPHA